MMASKFIGVLRSSTTGAVLAVINPDDDSELDSPRWLLMRPGQTDAIEMVRVPRGDYEGALTMEQVAELAERMKG
jgi:hypothetical protein